MAVRFRIGQTSRPLGPPDTSRHDLVINEAIQLVAVEPAPGAGITYQWEIIDRAYTQAELSASDGASTTIGPSDARPFGFEIELRAYKNGTLQGATRRIAGSRSPVHDLRLAMFGETADAASRLGDPRPVGSTDNALYDSLAGGPGGQNWRGWAQFLNEIVLALEHVSGGSGGGGDATHLRGTPVANDTPTLGQVLTFGNGAWAPRAIPAPSIPNTGGDLSGAITNARVMRIRGEPVADQEPEEGQLLGYQSGAWHPTTPEFALPEASGDVSGAIDALVVDRLKGHPVAAGVPAAGQVLSWLEGHTPAWTPRTLTADGDVEGALGELVVTGLYGRPLLQTTPTPGQLLAWHETPTPGWGPVDPPEIPEPEAPSGDAVSLQGRDIDEAAPNVYDVLAWDGTLWAPARAPVAGFAVDPGAVPTVGQTLILFDDGINAPTWRFGPSDTMDASSLLGRPLDDEVPLDGQYLEYDETAGSWRAQDLKIAGFGIADTAPDDGQILVFREDVNGAAWRLEELPSGDASMLRGRAVSIEVPEEGDQLVYRDDAWTPEAPPIASRSQDGYLSQADFRAFEDKAGLDAAALILDITPIHIYIATTGNDTHIGTIAQPLRTVAGAYAHMPLIVQQPFILHFASGTYEYTPPPPHILVNRQNGCIIFVGDGAGQVGDDGFIEIASGTTGPGSTDISIVPSGSPAVDAYAYCTLLITNNGQDMRRLISRNTAGAMIPSLSVNVAPTVGTAYRIVRPAVIFNVTAAGPWSDAYNQVTITGAAKLVHYVQLAFTGARIKTGPDSLTSMFGVELRDACTLSHQGVALTAAANAGAHMRGAWDVPALLGASWAWEGWGITSRTTGVALADVYGEFHGYMALAGRLLFASTGDTVRASSWRGGRVGAITTRGYHHLGCYNAPCHIVCNENVIALDLGSTFSGNNLHVEQNGSSWGIVVQRIGKLFFGYITAVCTVPNYTALRVMGEFALENNPCSFSSVNAPAIHVDGGTVRLNYYLTATASASGNGAVLVECGGQIHGCGAYGTLAVSNTGTGANTDGVRVKSGGFVTCYIAPTVSSAGSTGFGVNCRGGGRFMMPGQPTLVTGPTADFSVGVNAGDDFGDIDLAVPYATRVSGLSAVGRSA